MATTTPRLCVASQRGAVAAFWGTLVGRACVVLVSSRRPYVVMLSIEPMYTCSSHVLPILWIFDPVSHLVCSPHLSFLSSWSLRYGISGFRCESAQAPRMYALLDMGMLVR